MDSLVTSSLSNKDVHIIMLLRNSMECIKLRLRSLEICMQDSNHSATFSSWVDFSGPQDQCRGLAEASFKNLVDLLLISLDLSLGLGCSHLYLNYSLGTWCLATRAQLIAFRTGPYHQPLNGPVHRFNWLPVWWGCLGRYIQTETCLSAPRVTLASSQDRWHRVCLYPVCTW